MPTYTCPRCDGDDTVPVYRFLPAGVAILRAPPATIRTDDGSYVPQPARFCVPCARDFPCEPSRALIDEAFYAVGDG